MSITTWKTKTFSQDKESNLLEGMKSRRRELTTNIEENYETKKVIERMQEISQKKDPNYKNIEKLNSVYDKNDSSNGMEEFNNGIDEMNSAIDEMTNIFKKDPKEDDAIKKNGNVTDSAKKESFKEGNKCKRNTEMAKYIKIIKNVIDTINDILFVKFDTYLTRGISVVYDQIEGSNKSGFIDMKNSENMANVGSSDENMESDDENMENMESDDENMENMESDDENMENVENMENIVEGLKRRKKSAPAKVKIPKKKQSNKKQSNKKSAKKKQSKKKSNYRSKDINLIKDQVYYILSIPIALLITYNWFFLMFYKENDTNRVNRSINLDIFQPIMPILNFFFKYSVKVTVMLDSIMMDKIPNILDTLKKNKILDILLNTMSLFIILVSVIAYILCNYSSKIKNAGMEYLKGSKNPPYVNQLYGIVVVFIILSFFPTNIIEYISNKASFMASPLTSILSFLIQLVFTLVNINLTGLLPILYIVSYSFTAMSIYSDNDNKNTIKNINEYLYNSIKIIGVNDCPPGSLNWWQRFFKIIIEIIYHCLYESVYMLFFFIGFIMYLIYMNSLSCKLAFAGINLFIITAIGMITYYSKIKDLIKEIIKSKNS